MPEDALRRNTDLPKNWQDRNKPCPGYDVIPFTDKPFYGWTTKTAYTGEPKPWTWEHRILVTIKSGENCVCRFNRVAVVIVKKCTIASSGASPKCTIAITRGADPL
jgi:hypothetical protein